MNYLIYGNSFNLIDDQIKSIVKGREHQVFRLSETNIKDILENLSYTDLFSEEKIVVIKEFENIIDNKKYQEDFEKLINVLSDSNENIIIFVSSIKIKNTGKTNKAFLEKVKIIETFMGTKSYEIVNFFKDFFRKANIIINDQVLDKLVSKCTYNVDIVLSEFKKLKLYGITDRITDETVNQLVCNYNTNDIFELKDAILNKEIDMSIELLTLAENSKMDVLPIIIMLAKEYMMTYNIKRLSSEGKSNEEISSILFGIHPYRVKILRSIAQKYNLNELEKIILYLCNLNQKFVSQDNLGYDELKIFIIDFLMK